MKTWDVIVAGAGVAGLAAAAQLLKSGLKVLVLEARDRGGGRIFTGLAPEHGIDLGAEFVHGKPREFDDYLAVHRLNLREPDGQTCCSGKTGPESCKGLDTWIFDQLYEMD